MARRRKVRFAWLTIKDGIRDEIFEGKYQTGDRIPTVTELASKHGVSTATVRQAIDELASEGFVEIRQGRGTIVAPPKKDYDPFCSFTEQAERLGGEPRTEIYETQWRVPHVDVIKALGLNKGEQVWEVVRLRYLDDEPVMIEVTAFTVPIAEQVVGDSRKLESLFRTLREELGYRDWDLDVSSVNVTTERTFSDLLGIPRRTSFFHIMRRTLVEGKPILVSSIVLRSDKFQLHFGVHHNVAGEQNERAMQFAYSETAAAGTEGR